MGRIKAVFVFIVSFVKFIFVSNIPLLDKDQMVFRGCKRSEIKAVESVYKRLSGRGFSKLHKLLLYFFSQRFLFVALSIDSQEERVVGLDFYYINYRDFKEKTIHEGYIGVLPDFEGRGIATQMRKQAMGHFSSAGLKGISTRISKSNLGSLSSAEKLGFKPMETYFDERFKEDRCYLVKWF